MTKFIKNIKERIDEAEEGFTLIELMVVVLIIGILMAIAIPTFLGAKNSANARAAQSNLRNSVTAEQSYFTDNSQTYGTGAALTAAKYETAITFVDANPAAPPAASGNQVTVEGAPGASVLLGAKGADGKCYYVNDNAGQVAYYSDLGAASCAAMPPALPGNLAANSKNGWGSVW